MTFNPNQPSPSVPKFFIQALTTMGGVNEFGLPNFRLVWGGTHMHFAYGRMRIKYLKNKQQVPVAWEIVEDGQLKLLPFSALQEGDNHIGRIVKDWIDEGIPRFFIEEWIPPDEAKRGWELNRWGDIDPYTGQRIDILGEVPTQGLYQRWICLQTDAGEYMPPAQQTLDWIQKMLWIREHDEALKSWTWRERPPTHVVEGVLRQKYYEMYEAEDRDEERLADIYYNRLAPSIHRLTDTPIIIK